MKLWVVKQQNSAGYSTSNLKTVKWQIHVKTQGYPMLYAGLRRSTSLLVFFCCSSGRCTQSMTLALLLERSDATTAPSLRFAHCDAFCHRTCPGLALKKISFNSLHWLAAIPYLSSASDSLCRNNWIWRVDIPPTRPRLSKIFGFSARL